MEEGYWQPSWPRTKSFAAASTLMQLGIMRDGIIFSLQVNGRPMPAVRTRFAERQEIALDSERDTVKGVPPSRHGTDEAAPH